MKSTKPTRLLLSGVLALAAISHALAQAFTVGDLLVSRSVYTGTSALVTVGQPLPGGGLATADGSYPGVWANETPDVSFGVTAPIFLDQITTAGVPVSTLAVDPTQIVTSFSSKSELALNL